MLSLCQLQDSHGNDLRFFHWNDHARAEFIRYIAQYLQKTYEKVFE